MPQTLSLPSKVKTLHSDAIKTIKIINKTFENIFLSPRVEFSSQFLRRLRSLRAKNYEHEKKEFVCSSGVESSFSALTIYFKTSDG